MAASLCVEPQSPGSGTAAQGTLTGSLDSGRILFTMEAIDGSGTFAFATIDSAGPHVVSVDDRTLAHAIWAPAGGIVFDSERSDDRHLFHMADDGSGATQITSGFRVAEQSAAISQSGRLVYSHYGCSADNAHDLGLQVATAEGPGAKGLTQVKPFGQSDLDAAISPDGKTVAFVRSTDDSQSTGGLFEVPVDGGAEQRLLPDTFGMGSPSWSPDGKTILFNQVSPSGKIAVWTVQPASGAPKQLSSFSTDTFAFSADWSPDGSEIVFVKFAPNWDYNELHVISADGTNDRTLWMGDHSTANAPHWGP